MGRPKKLKLNEMNVANGKIWDGNEIEVRGKNPYLSLSLAEYQEKLENMNLFDLQNLAVESLVLVKDKRETLIKNLIDDFKIKKKIS